MKDGPYSIGSPRWNGLSKVIEECGEVLQIAGKIIGNNGRIKHWDGSDLEEKMAEELSDLQAALTYFVDRNLIDYRSYMSSRITDKLKKFNKWNSRQK